MEKRREHLSSFLKGVECAVFALMSGFIVPALTSACNKADLLSVETVLGPMTSAGWLRSENQGSI